MECFLMYRHAMEGEHLTNLSSTTVPLYQRTTKLWKTWGFKVTEDVMVVQARLVIPPSTCGNLAMSSGDVSATSKIANVRIYVEQAIGRLKYFVS